MRKQRRSILLLALFCGVMLLCGAMIGCSNEEVPKVPDEDEKPPQEDQGETPDTPAEEQPGYPGEAYAEAQELGFKYLYTQSGESADESFIPEFR